MKREKDAVSFFFWKPSKQQWLPTALSVRPFRNLLEVKLLISMIIKEMENVSLFHTDNSVCMCVCSNTSMLDLKGKLFIYTKFKCQLLFFFFQRIVRMIQQLKCFNWYILQMQYITFHKEKTFFFSGFIYGWGFHLW